MSEPHAILADDHIETPTLRKYAPLANCAVIGAYKGATMRYLLDHEANSVAGVEPQKWARDLAVASLKDYGRWDIQTVALVPWTTSKNQSVMLHNVGTDGANILRRNRTIDNDSMLVVAQNVNEWLGISQFDFMVVNCEGAEYMLLPWLATRATVLLVQFHGPPIPRDQMAGLVDYDSMEDIGKGWFLYS